MKHKHLICAAFGVLALGLSATSARQATAPPQH
jgi:hypothetical protein